MYVFCAVSEMWICFQKMLDWLVRKNHHFVDQNGYSQKIAKNRYLSQIKPKWEKTESSLFSSAFKVGEKFDYKLHK